MSNHKTTWRKLINAALRKTGEEEIIATTLSDKGLDRKFQDGYGAAEGKPFTAWGKNYVYFPIVYDGAEWVGYAPRNPCQEKCRHFGGQ